MCEYISICIIQKVSKVLNIFTSMKFENVNIYINSIISRLNIS